MEEIIQITKLNDFMFCPQSIYFHSVYENFSQSMYHRTAQYRGKLKHDSVDQGKYSTAKKYLQGMEVASEKYGLVGKIDIYDQEKKELIERKAKVAHIYDGYRYQLYAQMFCLQEMGQEIKKLSVYSMADNKKYPIDLPDDVEVEKFEKLLEDIRSFDPAKFTPNNQNKCEQCVYKELCH